MNANRTLIWLLEFISEQLAFISGSTVLCLILRALAPLRETFIYRFVLAEDLHDFHA